MCDPQYLEREFKNVGAVFIENCYARKEVQSAMQQTSRRIKATNFIKFRVMAADPRGSPTTMFHYSLMRGPQHGERNGTAGACTMCGEILLGEIQPKALCSGGRGKGSVAERVMLGRLGRRR